MAESSLFGIFIFNRWFTLLYRFLSDDLFNYLYKRHQERLDVFEIQNLEADETPFSIDDTIVLTLSTLVHFYDQSYSTNNLAKRITLESNIEVLFDEFEENRIIIIYDKSFDTLIILKVINLFKSLIRFYFGAYPFKNYSIIAKAIDRISASLQYYLDNILINQSLLFESCEYLLLNPLIHRQYNEACLIVKQILQQIPTLIMITCKDKIVHMQINNQQNRPSNSDIFLLLLNNTSRTLRKQFQTDDFESSTMAHTFRQNTDDQMHYTESMKNNTQQNIEVIFMKTLDKSLAPFTMYTIPLKNDTSVLILIESKHSLACVSLSELIHQLNVSINQSQLSYKHLRNHIKSLEKHPIFVPQLNDYPYSANKLLRILDKTHAIYKSLPRKAELIDQEDERIYQIQDNLFQMNDISFNIFHQSFLECDASNDPDIFPLSTINNLQQRLFDKLIHSFSFIEMKSQENITINFCQERFPGLVHFALIDRTRGKISSPALSTHADSYDSDAIKQKKIIDFELECLSVLQHGYTSYMLKDDYFTYNYILRLQKNNGTLIKLDKPFVKFEAPGILHYNFYEKLISENYVLSTNSTSISCLELICIHLHSVPVNIVREHCQQLWSIVKKLDD